MSSASPPPKRLRIDVASETELHPVASTSASGQDKAAVKAELRRSRQKRKDYAKQLEKTGREPIEFDIEEMLGTRKMTDLLSEGLEYSTKLARGDRFTVQIDRLDAHGDGLAVVPGQFWVVAVPNVLPAEKVEIEITGNERLYSKAKVVALLEESVERNASLVQCKYFGQCGGCQYQMISYDKQLSLKRDVVARAFARFSNLDPSLVPAPLSTMPSPKEYKYRTKLTPHFNLPYELRRGRRSGVRNQDRNGTTTTTYDVPIGFDNIGTKQVMDIEECPIATNTINRAMPIAKQKVRDTIESFKNGATLLLRDSLASFESFAEDQGSVDGDREPDTVVVTDHKATVQERVFDTKFESPAGTFFQNNRSILPSLLQYVRDEILASTPAATEQRYLVDAYCGSGLFSLCLASLFHEVSGVEISAESIRYATKNAGLNGITNAKFLAGNAEAIFGQIEYPPAQTTVIIDPPRRGCDIEFIRQLVRLGPQHIVYVSCNVHTQARDVGQLITLDPSYTIKSIRGADLFPQTHHVEGVCVLQRTQ